MPDIVVTTHWLFAGRFVVYVLGFVMIWGAALDWVSYRKQPAPRPHWAFHAMVITGSLAIMLASPARYEVARRLLVLDMSEYAINALLFTGLIFACLSFMFAQITRARYKGATRKKIVRGVVTTLLGILILAAVGVGLNVQLR